MTDPGQSSRACGERTLSPLLVHIVPPLPLPLSSHPHTTIPQRSFHVPRARIAVSKWMDRVAYTRPEGANERGSQTWQNFMTLGEPASEIDQPAAIVSALWVRHCCCVAWSAVSHSLCDALAYQRGPTQPPVHWCPAPLSDGHARLSWIATSTRAPYRSILATNCVKRKKIY